VTSLVYVVATIALAIGAAACNDTPSPTSPTETTTTTTIGEPTITEEFNGTVSVGGFSFYSFTVAESGTLRVRLVRVSGPSVPATVWLGLGVGTPAGEDCVTSTALNTQAGDTAQISGTYSPGIYCARVHDIGNLAAAASVYVTIDHP
jgi:hypothetical protein